MMSERSEVDVFVSVDAEMISVCFRSIFLTFRCECFRILTEICGHNTVKSLYPGCGKLPVRIPYDCFNVSLQRCIKFAVFRLVCSVVESRHRFLRYDSVVLYHVEYITERASGCEIKVSVQTDILYCSVSV